LDVFGQNPRLHRLYTQLCFCFRLASDTSQHKAQVVDHLNRGLDVLAQAFPWVGGVVTQDSSGIFKIHSNSTKKPWLDVQDLSDSLPSMQELETAGFPFRMLDEKVIAPCSTLPDSEESDKDAPVLLLRATFITGGLLLVINGMHNCMDMAGQCQVIDLFAKACRGEGFTAEELKVGNISRQNLVPLLEEDQTSTKLPPGQKQMPTTTAPASTESEPPRAVWHYFTFSAAYLASLKAIATTDVPSGFVSTDDVLSAFVWQNITRARLPRLDSAGSSTFDRQVNARHHLGVPLTYPGNGPVHKVSTTRKIADVVDAALGVVASHLRSSLINEDIAYKVRAEATALSRSVARGETKTAGPSSSRSTVPTSDLKMSSWAKENCYAFDFGGLLGKASAVRRPAFPAWEGLCYFMPKTLAGDIAFAVCLRDEDAERLIVEEEFGEFG
ncbi:putative trichothecene 3-O-acetyltransferase, partial [Neohortaea acidophila]